MAPSEGVIAVDEIQIRAAITAYLEGALEFAERLNDSAAAYLIERARAARRHQTDPARPPDHAARAAG
jgi:hypothetical protein